LIFFANFFYSLFRGPVAGRNPWHSNTLEWTAPSPPPHGNFLEPPVVRRGPYEYSVPGMEEDYLPQTDPQPSGVPVVQPGH
jgi:cytochrome c oxidase subunit 1